MENAWQYTKVYDYHVDQNENPTQKYWTWAQEGWNNPKPQRYPMGKGAIPLYSLWNGSKLSYIEARKKIYAPLYSNAVIKTNAYQILKNLAAQGDVTLWDFDGYDYLKFDMTLKDVMNNPLKKCGHAFILAMMLTDQLEECVMS